MEYKDVDNGDDLKEWREENKGLRERLKDVLQNHSAPSEMVPQFRKQKMIVLEYNRLVPALIDDIVAELEETTTDN